MRKREVYVFAGALAILDSVVADVPGYAEGWNERAFIRFLRDDFDGSLDDIEHALALEPLHFAALAGKATVLMRQGRSNPARRLCAAQSRFPLVERALDADSGSR